MVMSGWARNRFEQYREKAAATTPELDAYDQEIVKSTLELRDELKIPETKYNPYRIEWLDKLPGQEKSQLGVYSTDFLTIDPSLITLQKLEGTTGARELEGADRFATGVPVCDATPFPH